MTDLPTLTRWKKYLRADPTRWLLETDDPSILVWYQIDIAHRPEDSRAVTDTRERVLYSEPVQTIFAAQDDLGYWGDPEHLAQPRCTGTLWNLALLAELGIPHASRRARRACEFVLQNFLGEDGTFAGLTGIESGYLIHALTYFDLSGDERVTQAARRLMQEAADSNEDALRIAALWGIEKLDLPESGNDSARDKILDQVHSSLGDSRDFPLLGFPHFDPRDPLFILRVLNQTEFMGDPRVTHIVDKVIAKQNERAQWMCEKDSHTQLLIPFEKQNAPSRWVTLNALRVIVPLVISDERTG